MRKICLSLCILLGTLCMQVGYAQTTGTIVNTPYTPTTGDSILLERVDKTLGEKIKKARNSIPVMMQVQEKVSRILDTYDIGGRAGYLLKKIDDILLTHIKDTEIGQPAGSIAGTGDNQHLFNSISLGGIQFENYIRERGPIDGEFPDIRIEAANAGTGKLIANVLFACGPEGFIMYELYSPTRISIDENDTALFEPSFLHPDLSNMMASTGQVAIECRLYDLLYTKDYFSTSLTFEVVEMPESYHEIVLEGIVQDTSYETLAEAEDSNIELSIFMKNYGAEPLTGSVEIGCHTPSLRKESEKDKVPDYRPLYERSGDEDEEETTTTVDDEETVLGYTSFSVEIGPGQTVGKEYGLTYDDTYTPRTTVECRLNEKVNEHFFLKTDLPTRGKTFRLK